MYKAYIGETECEVDVQGFPQSVGGDKVYFKNGIPDYVGSAKIERDKFGTATKYGTSYIKSRYGCAYEVDGQSVSGTLRFDAPETPQ